MPLEDSENRPESGSNTANTREPSEILAELSNIALNALEGLVRVIADGSSIVYVGAGVSQSAGLPSWGNLLNELQSVASGRLENQDDVARYYFKELKNKSRSLEVGDWLLTILGPEFQQVISRVLSEGEDLCQIEPSTVHWNIVRLPFSMAVTTNYDLLLEMAHERAYRVCRQKLPYLTWKHTEEILRASNQKPFRIVHAHGTVGDSDSIVLSGRQYAMLHNAHPRFGTVLKWLLKTKTFLFIGAGLEDPDLIFQLQEAVAEHGGAVGPHYALIPYTQAPEIRRQILRNSLNIEVIPVGSSEYVRAIKATGGEKWITPALSAILQALSGKVALRAFDRALPGFPTSDDPTFCLATYLRILLKHAIEATGSFRGDFCLSPDGIASHLSGELLYEISEGPTGVTGHKVAANSICGIAYHQATTEFGVYVKDVSAGDLAEGVSETSKLGHFGKIEYIRSNSEVKSELAMPVEADGVRVGVLNLESNLLAAYSDDHIRVARRFAEKAGRLYAAAHERERRGIRLNAAKMEYAYFDMIEICARLWEIARSRTNEIEKPTFALLVYHADYRTGNLVSQDPRLTILKGRKPLVGPQCFEFHNLKSKNSFLATRVFLDGRPYFYPDVTRALNNGKITNNQSFDLGLTIYGPGKPRPTSQSEELNEPIIGFPVLIHGHIAGVIVAWQLNARPTVDEKVDGRDIELIRRASHLMANNFDWRRRGQAPEVSAKSDVANLKQAEASIHAQPDRTEQSSSPKKHITGAAGASIEKVNRILRCFDSGTAPLPVSNPEDKDFARTSIPNYVRNATGGMVAKFLDLLLEQEKDFVMSMKPSAKPAKWISPQRCRVWVRVQAQFDKDQPGEDKPTFALAYQLDRSNSGRPWKSLFDPLNNGNPKIIANRPFTRPDSFTGPDSSESSRRNGDVADLPEETSIKFGHHEASAYVYDDTPHLSFLLSRVSVYPFSFMQRPETIGRDIMAEVLEKDPNLPWFVAPMIRADRNRWREDKEPDDSGAGEHTDPNAKNRLVGYLTFDNPPNISELLHGASDEPLEVREEWSKFQNDLLHQTALFAACLAQNLCFFWIADV